MGLQAISTHLDPNTHGAGFLQARQLKVFIKNFKVCLSGDLALQDLECHPDNPPIHCAPAAIDGSSKVYILGIGVHRHDDRRACDATTIAFPFNSKVFAG